jgi:hypothetical protein
MEKTRDGVWLCSIISEVVVCYDGVKFMDKVPSSDAYDFHNNLTQSSD